MSIPPVEIGQIVHFFRDAEVRDTPYAAVVTAVHEETVDVCCFIKDSMNVHPPSGGIRHASDPRLKNPEVRKLGCWDHMPFTRKVMKLFELLDSPTKPAGKS